MSLSVSKLALLLVFSSIEISNGDKKPFVLRVLSPKPKSKAPQMLHMAMLPEAHLPLPFDVEPETSPLGTNLLSASKTYSFCGENTKVAERLSLGYRGVNSLDRACLIHDVAYLHSTDKKVRRQMDLGLLQAAMAISNDVNLPTYERNHAAAIVTSLAAKLSY